MFKNIGIAILNFLLVSKIYTVLQMKVKNEMVNNDFEECLFYMI